MALPDDATVCTVSFGPYTDAEGLAALASSGGKLTTVAADTGKPINVTHVATGQVILPKTVDITIGSDGTGSVGPIPHTDNPGLSPVGFAYRVEWNIASNRPSPRGKTFALPQATGATADFDLLDVAEAVPGVLVPIGEGPQGPAGPTGPTGPPGSSPVLTDATPSAKGVVQLAGDLGGSAAAPTVPGLATKQDVATLSADMAGHVGDGSAFDLAQRAAFVPLEQLAADPDLLIVGTITRDGNGAATSAPVVWPDGSPGTYTADTVSTAFPGAVDAYHVTYGNPVTRTFTQPAVTRNGSGAVTARPAIVES